MRTILGTGAGLEDAEVRTRGEHPMGASKDNNQWSVTLGEIERFVQLRQHPIA